MSRAKSTMIVVAAALLAIGGLLTAAVVLTDGAGLGNSDTDQPAERGDTSPNDGDTNGTEPVDDDSPAGDDGESEDDGTPPDNNSTENGANESEQDNSELASISVSASVVDLGPAETGTVVLYNRSSDRSVAVHDFEDGSSHTFEEIPPGYTYELSVASERAPPETVLVEPERGEEIKRSVELGYEFQGASTFEAVWRLEYNDGTVLEDGYEALDSEANYLTGWEDPRVSDRWQNFYSAELDEWYTTAGEDNWFTDERDEIINGTFTTKMVRQGLDGIENRTYIEEADAPRENGTVHKYRVPPMPDTLGNSVTATFEVEPETGYIVWGEVEYEEYEDSSVVTAPAIFFNHDDRDFEAVPDDFPIDNPPR